MKGDGYIKKISIKFIGAGYKNNNQVKVKIYDTYNNLVFQGNTYDSKLSVSLKTNNVYIVKARFINEKTCIPIYTSNDNFTFILNHNIISNSEQSGTVTFLLTDYYYNLPIEKGEILLWQK